VADPALPDTFLRWIKPPNGLRDNPHSVSIDTVLNAVRHERRRMELESFFPYRLAVLAEAVSRSMAQVYGERFDLARDEWRVLAALAAESPQRTGAVIERTTLDKVSASRALVRMEAKALVARETDPNDGRGYLIRLLPAGRQLYRRIEPMVLAREQFLLDALDADERQALGAALDKLLQRARRLAQQG
jgi:DNA-binding MarR family transcriptional regulator